MYAFLDWRVKIGIVIRNDGIFQRMKTRKGGIIHPLDNGLFEQGHIWKTLVRAMNNLACQTTRSLECSAMSSQPLLANYRLALWASWRSRMRHISVLWCILHTVSEATLKLHLVEARFPCKVLSPKNGSLAYNLWKYTWRLYRSLPYFQLLWSLIPRQRDQSQSTFPVTPCSLDPFRKDIVETNVPMQDTRLTTCSVRYCRM